MLPRLINAQVYIDRSLSLYIDIWQRSSKQHHPKHLLHHGYKTLKLFIFRACTSVNFFSLHSHRKKNSIKYSFFQKSLLNRKRKKKALEVSFISLFPHEYIYTYLHPSTYIDRQIDRESNSRRSRLAYLSKSLYTDLMDTGGGGGKRGREKGKYQTKRKKNTKGLSNDDLWKMRETAASLLEKSG